MGTLYRPFIVRHLPGGTVKRERSRRWRMRWRDSGKGIHEESAFHDKAASRALMAQRETEQAQVDAGLLSSVQRQHGKAPFSEHLKAYLQGLEAEGRDDEHRQHVEAALARMAEFCGWGRLSDISAADLNRFLTEGLLIVRRLPDGKKTREPATANTRNHFRGYLKALCRWAFRTERLLRDPLISIEPEEGGEPRFLRRALTAEEAARLLAAAEGSGPDGLERAALYGCALEAGLRAGEAFALTWGDFLDGAESVLHLRPSTTKNRERIDQPIREALAGRLRALKAARAGAFPKATIFKKRWRLAETLRADLLAAGIPDDTEAGKVDYHSLRHTYVTLLARGGASLLLVQKLARHCSPDLTARVYIHLGLADRRGALAALPAQAAIAPAQAPGTAGSA